jgi:hypothetical protein
MGAYNRTNGEPCCASPTLLGRILRGEWGFTGFVVSDCGAIYDFHAHHTVTSTPEQSAALAVKNGCDLECGRVYPALVEAVRKGLIAEAEIDTALARTLRIRFRLGMFDPTEKVPYAAIPYEKVDCEEHRALALDAARASIVLLKNSGAILPLKKDLPCIAVIGRNADDREALLGNYSGLPSRSVTVLEGIRNAVGPATRVLYVQGSDNDRGAGRFSFALSQCRSQGHHAAANQLALQGKLSEPINAVTPQCIDSSEIQPFLQQELAQDSCHSFPRRGEVFMDRALTAPPEIGVPFFPWTGESTPGDAE